MISGLMQPQPAAAAAVLPPPMGHLTSMSPPSSDLPANSQGAGGVMVLDKVPVVCGTCKGVLLVKQGRIMHEGQEMSPTEFERLGGKASAKKWKNSVRVMLSDGSSGGTIGDWLQEHGVDIRNNQVFVSGESSGVPPRSSSTGAGGAPAASRPLGSGSHHTSDGALARMARTEQLRLGLLPGDPTVQDLPHELPRPANSAAAGLGGMGSGGSTTPVDLNRFKMHELNSLASVTSSNPMGALLPQQPGVPSHRLAYVSGQEPRRRVSPAERARALSIIIETVHGKRAGSPWAALGVQNAPLLAGMELDLARLYAVVAELGGCQVVHLTGAWHQVAARMGADLAAFPMAASQAKLYYLKLLLAVERYERDRGLYPPASAMGQGMQLGSSAGFQAATSFDDFLMQPAGGGMGAGPSWQAGPSPHSLDGAQDALFGMQRSLATQLHQQQADGGQGSFFGMQGGGTNLVSGPSTDGGCHDDPFVAPNMFNAASPASADHARFAAAADPFAGFGFGAPPHQGGGSAAGGGSTTPPLDLPGPPPHGADDGGDLGAFLDDPPLASGADADASMAAAAFAESLLGGAGGGMAAAEMTAGKRGSSADLQQEDAKRVRQEG